MKSPDWVEPSVCPAGGTRRLIGPFVDTKVRAQEPTKFSRWLLGSFGPMRSHGKVGIG